MYVSSVNLSDTERGDAALATVSLNAAFSPDPSTENHKFWISTPTGAVTLRLAAEEAELYMPGSFFYVDLQALEEGETAETEVVLRKLEQNGDWSRTIGLSRISERFSGGISVEFSVTNKVVWPAYRELGARYGLTLTATTKDGS